MGTLVFILVLSFLVLIHELGHFLMAKKAGVRVDEFGIGYPPRALTLYTDKSGTEYTINWLPFGGFVRLYGEDGPDTENGTGKDRAFFTKSIWSRMAIVLAGVVVNFVFGALAFGAIYTKLGIPTQTATVQIDAVSPGSPAQVAGIEEGDSVVWVGNRDAMLEGTQTFVDAVSMYTGTEVLLGIEDKGEVAVYVRAADEIPEGEGALGVMISDMEFKHYPLWQMPFRGMVVGVRAAVNFGIMLVEALGQMLGDLIFRGSVPSEVAGPIGIAHLVQKEGILSNGMLAIVNFAAILSINLAIVNMLPFPALDGGRFVFLVYELISRRRVSARFEQVSNTIGFAMLLLLIMLISVRDVGRLIGDEGVREWWRGLLGR